MDLITDGSETWWASAEANDVVIGRAELEELEAVFVVPPRRGALAIEDAKAAAAAAVADVAQSQVEAARCKKKKSRSLVTDACGGKRLLEEL